MGGCGLGGDAGDDRGVAAQSEETNPVGVRATSTKTKQSLRNPKQTMGGNGLPHDGCVLTVGAGCFGVDAGDDSGVAAGKKPMRRSSNVLSTQGSWGAFIHRAQLSRTQTILKISSILLTPGPILSALLSSRHRAVQISWTKSTECTQKQAWPTLNQNTTYLEVSVGLRM